MSLPSYAPLSTKSTPWSTSFSNRQAVHLPRTIPPTFLSDTLKVERRSSYLGQRRPPKSAKHPARPCNDTMRSRTQPWTLWTIHSIVCRSTTCLHSITISLPNKSRYNNLSHRLCQCKKWTAINTPTRIAISTTPIMHHIISLISISIQQPSPKREKRDHLKD